MRSAVTLPVALIGGLLVPGAVSNGLNGVTFLFPTGGETFTFPNTVVNISYVTPFPAPQLFTWCGSFGGNIRHIRTEFVKPFSDFHLTPINFTNSDKCWFNLRPNETQGYGDNTGGFFIVADESAKSTTVGLATAAGPTSTSPPVASSTPTAVVTSPPTTDQSDPHGLSPGAVAGISVGAILVVAILCAAALAFWWANRKHAKHAGSSRSRWTPLDGSGRKPGGADAEEEPLATPVSGPGQWQTSNSLTNTYSHVSSHPRGRSPSDTPFMVSDGYYGAPSAHTSVAPSSGPVEDASSVSIICNTHSEVDTSPSSRATTVAAPIAPVAPKSPASGGQAAELPSIYTYRSWGGEQEMPVSETTAARLPYPNHGQEGAEQKFLLQDMQALKTQRQLPKSSDPGPGPYFAS
ncbi:hypothetical protein RB595_001211 [Gaeumannomyces hyphopodioides]